MIYIKNIEIEDSKDCIYLDSRSLNLWSQNQWENELINKHVNTLGIYSDELILGLCVFLIVVNEAELRYLSVDPSFRRKGLGSKLMNKFLEVCQRENITKVFLEVSNKNKEAISLYNSFGFETYIIRKKYYKDGSDAVLKEKNVK